MRRTREFWGVFSGLCKATLMHEEAEASSRVEACACRNLSLGRGKFLTHGLFLSNPSFLNGPIKNREEDVLNA